MVADIVFDYVLAQLMRVINRTLMTDSLNLLLMLRRYYRRKTLSCTRYLCLQEVCTYLRLCLLCQRFINMIW